MSDLAIRVESLSKLYRIGGKRERYRTLRHTLVDAFAAPVRRAGKLLRGEATGAAELDETFWALKDVSFEIKRGEVVGIIGRNGAGKSTLLKVLSRITEPTQGYAEIYGRVGSLLEVGTGFHPELTGRENIYLSGAILGMRRVEIERRLDEIVAFSEVERFLDTPVKHYSSGMGLRLAFAVAAHLDCDIALVDEVLAVGDAGFQRKCLGKMGTVAGSGRTVLFVSHNLAAIANLCPKTLLLSAGKLIAYGDTPEVLSIYAQDFISETQIPLRERLERTGSGYVRFLDVRIMDDKDNTLDQAMSGQDVHFLLEFSARDGVAPRKVDVALLFYGALEELLFVTQSRLSDSVFDRLPPHGTLECVIPRLPLPPGTYSIGIWCQAGKELADKIDHVATFTVLAGDFFGTGRLPHPKIRCVLVPHRWALRDD